MSLAHVYSGPELDRLMAQTYPLHTLLCVGKYHGGYISVGVRYALGTRFVVEDLEPIHPTHLDALMQGLRQAREAMGPRWLFRPEQKFSEN